MSEMQVFAGLTTQFAQRAAHACIALQLDFPLSHVCRAPDYGLDPAANPECS